MSDKSERNGANEEPKLPASLSAAVPCVPILFGGSVKGVDKILYPRTPVRIRCTL